MLVLFKNKCLCNNPVMNKYRGSRAPVTEVTKNPWQVEDHLLWQT